MSGSPKQKLELEQASEETTSDTRELYLADGRKLVVEDRTVEIRNESGMVEVRIELTDKGPVLRMESARLELRASEAVEIESPRVAIRGSEQLQLEGGKIEVEGEEEVTVESSGDVRVRGKMIWLN
ncbi:MAG: hypothetical protein ACM31C_21195 [Acidobacteriota bacterium]